ncbi:NUDIX domain-containing protein [Candidatus Bipolaricaulota bacterium]|nr:NUDIX domain-containing protein [Candidatus Bipolaricaulota bacterium]
MPSKLNPAVRVRAAGFVIFRNAAPGTTEYLLLRHCNGSHWSFPKGHLEPGEPELAGALRETLEETGLNANELEKIPDYQQEIVYRYTLGTDGATRRGVPAGRDALVEVEKTVIFFLACSTTEEIRLSSEHSEFRWATCEQAAGLLIHDGLDSVLSSADAFLRRRISRR